MEPRQPKRPGEGLFGWERAEDARPGAGQNAWPPNPVSGKPIPRPPPASAFSSRPQQGGAPRAGDRSANSGQLRAGAEERPPWEEDEPGYWSLEWESALSQSMLGVGADDPTGTGKLNAVVPLTPGESAWGRGISAPRIPAIRRPGAVDRRTPAPSAEVEEDSQPSARMRALAPGNLARATAIVTLAILISRVLGLFRTSLFAAAFGPGPDASAFTQAFTLPDTIFNIVAGGALASAFIPVFTDYMVNRRDRKMAWHVASAALNLSTLTLIIFAGICIAFATPILQALVPELFKSKPGVAPLGPEVVTLTQIMLLQPIFLGAATMAIAVLQARQRFLLPAMGQVIYTVGLIAGIVATIVDRRTHIFGGNLGIMGPTWGVVLGAALQLIVQIPGLAVAKMQYRLTFDLFHPGVLEMFRLMGPRILNSSMNYIAVFITRNFLAYLEVGTAVGITYGYYTAFTLMLLPQALFGAAVAQASFPTLATLVSDGQWERLRSTVLRTLRGVIYLAVPSALGMAVLARPIVEVLLAHGRYVPTAENISVVATPLIFFSVGLVGLSLDEILVRTFYALHDSRTPVYVNLANVAFVIGLSIILLDPMGAGGLALAFGLGAIGEAPVLLLLLGPRLGGLDLRGLGVFTLNVLAASLVTALTALFVYTLGRVVLGTPASATLATVYLAVELCAGIGAGTVVYYVFSRFLGIDDAVPLERLVRRVLRRR
jgi:putative peptidoglycan lipid II flippase